MNTATSDFPNEIWLRVFYYLVDGPSLKNVSLTSPRFHNLVMDELLRTLVWTTAEKAQQNLEFWDDNFDLAYIPTSLCMSFKIRDDSAGGYIHPSMMSYYAPDPVYAAILDHAGRFENLSTLTLYNGIIPAVFYHVLLYLPNLTHLILESCYVPDAPDHFPFSFPAFWDKDIDDIEIGVTHLTLRDVRRHSILHGFWGQIDLLNFLPDLESLTLGHLPAVGVPVLQRLTSLRLLSSHSPGETIHHLNTYLPHTSNLIHLIVDAPSSLTTRDSPPPIGLTPPLLETFNGPEFVAQAVLRGSPSLVSLAVNTPLAKTQDALDLIEQANAVTLLNLDLHLAEWDTEILIAITRRLAACRSIKVSFRFSQPSEDFLFNLGVEHLPLLSHLHTLHLLARPEDSSHSKRRGYYIDDEFVGDETTDTFRERAGVPKETRIAAVAPAEEACEDAVVAWTRYNKDLREVRLVRGREWTRREVEARWSVASTEE